MPGAVWTPSIGAHHASSDAIFTMAVAQSDYSFRIFLRSLRLTGCRADVVLTVDEELVPATRALLAGDPNVIAYATSWECTQNPRMRMAEHCVSTTLYGSAANDPRPRRQRAFVRFEMYQSWLRHYSPDSRVMLLDFRDVYFQTDPFRSLPQPSTRPSNWLYLYAEHIAIGNSRYNKRWLQSCYGRTAVSEQVLRSPVLCSGTSSGSVRALRVYLQLMLEQFDQTHCTLHGSDQGMHEHLYYSGQLLEHNVSAQVVPAGSGQVNNLASLRTEDSATERKLPVGPYFRRAPQHGFEVLSADGELVAVVHQYDRFGGLKRWARSANAPWNAGYDLKADAPK